MENLPVVLVERLRVAFGEAQVALKGLSFFLEAGKTLAIVGESGSGKSLTALALMGLLPKAAKWSGAIHISNMHITPEAGTDAWRGIRGKAASMVFQEPMSALNPVMKVGRQLAEAFRANKALSPSAAKAAATDWLGKVHIPAPEKSYHKYPHQLSGGQKQRVALARSLVVQPAVLLFDEPLSALDLSLRLQLRAEIKRLHDELGFSAIYVTHDQGEAMAMSSRVAVMNRGRIEQLDRPERIFHAPANEFVYNFIGESCCMPVKVASGAVADADGQPIDLRLGAGLPDGAWRLYVRPSRLKLAGASADAPNRLRARVHFVEFLGDVFRYHLRAGALELFADHPGRIAEHPGDAVELGWRDEDMKVFQ